MRWLRLVLGTLLLVGALSACTPPPLATVAMMVRDGRLTVVSVTCVGEFSHLGVFEDPPIEQPRTGLVTLVSWDVHGDAATEIIEVAAFGEPPAGWDAKASLGTRPLREFVPGVRYAASGDSNSTFVNFTTADLDRLDDGQVLAAGRRFGETRTMTYDDFVARARDDRGDCPKYFRTPQSSAS